MRESDVIEVLMCASDENGGHAQLLRKQLVDGGFEYHLGGPDGKFSWRKKLEWYRDQLKARPGDQKVILTDAYDVVFQGTEAEVSEKFPPKGTVLLTGEKNCWPDPEEQVRYPMGRTPWMFVNSGGIAGYAGDIAKAMDWGLENFVDRLCEDDQRFWSHLFFRAHGPAQFFAGLPRIEIDYECRIFQTMFIAISSELGVTSKKLMTNLRTGTVPHFLHFNGGGNWEAPQLELLGMGGEE